MSSAPLKNRNELKSLLEKCIKIKDDINSKIPLATNRFEEFECAKAGSSPQELAMLDANYWQHEKYVMQKQIEYQIYEEINRLFKEFLVDLHIDSPKTLSNSQKNNFKKLALKQSVTLCGKLTRTHKLLTGNESDIDVEVIDTYLQDNIEHFITVLSQGSMLAINDLDLACRFKKNLELAEYRDASKKQFQKDNVLLLQNIVDSHIADTIKKSGIFAHADYFDKPDIDIGFCDEHTCIALKRLYDECLIDNDTIVEKVSITYFDDNGHEDDGHTFLAINRDVNSPLNDISQWKGILLDPWNKIACLTDDFKSQPYYYFSYPDGAKWESIKFTDKDYEIKRNLHDTLTYFNITGNASLEKRKALLMDEYQLTSLDKSGLERTRDFLYGLLDQLKPSNFKGHIEILLTTRGAKLVDTLAGFSEPKIVIHSDFLKKMTSGIYTVEELKFALTNALLTIKHLGVGVYNNITSGEQHKIDRLTIEQCHDVPAGISYLRKSIAFEEQHKDDVSRVKIKDLYHRFLDGAQSDHLQRIKNLMTFVAINDNERHDKVQTSLANEILNEVLTIKKHFFFKEECDACVETVAKLNYLESTLPELTIELLPYELTSAMGIKVRDFCQRLYEIDIDFTDAEQLKALDQLLERAFQLRIASFERIYAACVHQHFNQYGYIDNDIVLRPLAFFNVINNTMADFIHANNFNEAYAASVKLKSLREQYKDHLYFGSCESASKQLRQFKITHQNEFPTGSDRFFGSSFVNNIQWHNFTAQNSMGDVPWYQHLKWAYADDSHVIADTLWTLGINNDQRLWSVFTPKELYDHTNLNMIESWPIAKLPKEYEQYGDGCYYETILEFLLTNHLKDFDATQKIFSVKSNFEEQFKQFYDHQWPALVQQADNKVIRFLLREFANVAISGAPEDKAVVKSFFLGRDDFRDLQHLLKPDNRTNYGVLTNKNHYVQFFVKQQFEEITFDLFTSDEQAKLINDVNMTGYDMPAQDLVTLFRLPFKSLTMPCLEQLIPLVSKIEKLNWACKVNIFLDHMKDHGGYRLLTRDTITLIKLITESIRNPADKRKILKAITWNLSDDVAQINRLTPDELIYLYRTFDAQLLFPSTQEEECFANLIMQRIRAIDNRDDRINALETLLFVENKITLPLSNIQLRNDAINILVADLNAKYGKDDQTPAYNEKIMSVIDRLFKNIARRDVTLILSRLADAIVSQWKISEHLGILLEPKRFLAVNDQDHIDFTIANLAVVTQTLSDDQNAILAFLEFISSPITNDTTDQFAHFLLQHDKINKLAENMGYGKEMGTYEKAHPGAVALMLRTFYAQFWDLTLEERAVIIDHLLVPANKVKTVNDIKEAYEEAFIYVAHKLFPNAETNQDENFAYSLLKAYLDTADQYMRSLLLSGILISTNQSNQDKPSAGKKLALLCEHMGPAYVKLAQAIHSHPETPESIRHDLGHIKGRANPPHRWQLWRLIQEVLPPHDKNDIKYIGALLGSASYNLALDAQLNNGQQVVLLMLRENAEKDAALGFSHLTATINACNHKNMVVMRDSVLSILHEAKESSQVEMDKELSQKQNQIAATLYDRSITITVGGKPRTIVMHPAHWIKGGEGYRFIERAYGIEFNDLPRITQEDIVTRKIIAKAVITVELINILSGGCFDSDRHGNQLCYQNNTLGLYDFGEMLLEPPQDIELRQLAQFLETLPKAVQHGGLQNTNFDELLSEHIKKVHAVHEPSTYLMRVRKAVLALHDFKKELTNEEVMEVLKYVDESGYIHPTIQTPFSYCMTMIGFVDEIYNSAKKVMNAVSFFGEKLSSLTKYFVLSSSQQSSQTNGKQVERSLN